MRRPLNALTIVAAILFLGCSNDKTINPIDAAPLPDSAGGTVDVRPVTTPDAAPPDATPVHPDAPPPDATPIDSPPPIDAPPPAPDATVAVPDAVPPPPDANLVPDANLTPDACVTDPRCDGSAGTHCGAGGALITCTGSGSCFQVTASTTCPGDQTCPSGGTQCECVADEKCGSGAGKYCDPNGSAGYYTCAPDVNNCVVSSSPDSACSSPEICTGASGHGACSCPAAGTTEGTGCSAALSCDSTTGDVLKCSSVGGCMVWTVQTDCMSLGLTCNNTECVCPTNTSHNYFVGPNYSRTDAPGGLQPTGVLTASGLCTFETLGDGLNAAAIDVAMSSPTQVPEVRVIAIALPGTTAVFTNETFPLVVGNRTRLTTAEDPDPNIAGLGFHPADYTISFNSSDEVTAQGVAMIVDPRVTSGAGATAGTGTPAVGGNAKLSGFTIQPTQENIDNTDAGMPDLGGAQIALLTAGGECDVNDLILDGGGSDAHLTRRLATPTQHVMRVGLGITDLDIASPRDIGGTSLSGSAGTFGGGSIDQFDATDAGGAWGLYKNIVVKSFGNWDSTDAIVDMPGTGVFVQTSEQGKTSLGVPHRADVNGLDIQDCYYGYIQEAGNVTFDTTTASDVKGNPHGTGANRATTVRVGLVFGPQDIGNGIGGETDGLIDFQSTALVVQNTDEAGIRVDSLYPGSGTGTVSSPFVSSSVRLTGGSIDSTLDGDGVQMFAGGQVFTATPTNKQVGGLLLNGVSITNSGGNGINVDTDSTTIPAILTATGVTISGALDNGIFAINNSDGAIPVILEFDGGTISANGTLDTATTTRAIHGFDLVNSVGYGLQLAGVNFTSTMATAVTGNVLGGLYAADAGDSQGVIDLTGTTFSGNGQDACPMNVAGGSIKANQAFSCRSFAVLVENTGGFTADTVSVVDNLGPGVAVLSGADDGGDPTMRCGSGGLCPLQVFTGATIKGNGSGTVRDMQATNTQTTNPGRGGATQGVLVDQGGAVLLTGSTLVQANKGVGVDVTSGGALYTGDVTIDTNGTNAGITNADQAPVSDPQSGLAIESGGAAQLTGSAADKVVISANAQYGILLLGYLDGLNMLVETAASHGIFVNTTDDNSNDAAHAGSIVKDVEIAKNGGDGIFIAAAGAGVTFPPGPTLNNNPPTCDPAFTVAGDHPTVVSLTSIHDNKGLGVEVGSRTAADQPGDICATIGDADIFDNTGTGIQTAQPTTGGHNTVALILDNNVYLNGGNGLLVLPSYVGQANGAVETFSGNRFHSNTLNQAVFDGGGGGNPLAKTMFNVDTASGTCDGNSSAFYCYGGTVGIFAQNNADLTVKRSEFETPQSASDGRESGSDGTSIIMVTNSCTLPMADTTCP